jgi:hypothetical protein
MLTLVVPLVAWTIYKTVLVHWRAASCAAPAPVFPAPHIYVIATTEVLAKFEGDETMGSVRDFWSPISPGPPGLHVKYKNLEVVIGTAVDPATTHLPLLTRDTSRFFYDSDHSPVTPSAGITTYTLRSTLSAVWDALTNQTAHHECTSATPAMNEADTRTPLSTPESVRTVCTLSLHPLETPTKATCRQFTGSSCDQNHRGDSGAS